MATVRTAEAHWEGSLFEGQGEVELVSSGLGQLRGHLGGTRRATERQYQPRGVDRRRALHVLQHALSNVLAQGGTPPTSLDTRADVTFDPPNITGIKLTVTGVVPGITAEQFEEAAQDARENCPVSKAITGTTDHARGHARRC